MGIDIPGDLETAEVLFPISSKHDAESIRQFISSLPTPLSLEYLGQDGRRAMMLRGPKEVLRSVADKVTSTWPGSRLQTLDADFLLDEDSARTAQLFIAFSLKKPAYLPIRTPDRNQHADSVQVILDAMLGLGEGERLWLQLLLLRRQDPIWLPEVQKRLKTEKQRGYVISEKGQPQFASSGGGQYPELDASSLVRGLAFLFSLLIALVLALLLIQRASWNLMAISAGLILLTGWAWKHLRHPDDPWTSSAPEIVGQKVLDQDVFYEVLLRASARADQAHQVEDLLSRITDALSVYSLAGGNHFVQITDPFEGQGAWPTGAFEPDQPALPLSAGEIGALWHIPAIDERITPGQTPVSGVETRSPDPYEVRGFYELGRSFHGDGSPQPVFLSETTLERNSLLVGKPGTGKSNTMIHLALAGMRHPEQPALVVVDPHGDMADHLYGAIDPSDKDRVRIIDLGDRDFALTLNPLDPHREGWDVLGSANSIVDIGRSLWGQFWGPRMQDPAKQCLKIIAAANESRDRDELLGLSLLSQLVNGDQELFKQFIESELEDSPYRDELSRWSFKFFHKLSKYRREDMILSILYKANRFAERPLLHLFSSPKSMLDLGELIRKRQVLIINTRKSHFGADVSDFVGSLVINLVLRQIARQGEMRSPERHPVLVIVDEFQSFSGVSWMEALGETRKHGGRFIIGTQNFASLKGNKDKEEPDVRGQIMGAVQPLFVFQVNGEDAEYLSTKELSGKKGGPSPETLTNLEPYRAYVRMVRENGQVTHPFYFETAAPPETSAGLAEEVLAMRATYSLRFEEAETGARRQYSYLDRYGRTLLTQGDTGAGRRAASRGEVRRGMLRQSDADQTAEAEVRRALLGEHEVELENQVREDEVPSVADGISPEMLELLEAKLRPDDDTPDDTESDDEEAG